MYHNNDSEPLLEFSDTSPPPFTPSLRFDYTFDPRPIPLGAYAPGDKVYIAIGSNTLAAGDEMRLDFTISMEPVPEPGIVALLAPAGLMLLRRRGR